jgi:hypothetical protein
MNRTLNHAMNRSIKLSATKRIALMGVATVILSTVVQSANAQMPILPQPAAKCRCIPPPPPPPPKPAPKK